MTADDRNDGVDDDDDERRRREEVARRVPKHRLVDVAGDGDCFLHAVGEDPHQFTDIRRAVSDELTYNAVAFAQYTQASVHDVETLARNVRDTGEFFEDVTVRAFCVVQRRDLVVVVLRGDGSVFDVYVHTSDGRVCALADHHAHLWEKDAVALDLDRHHYLRLRPVREVDDVDVPIATFSAKRRCEGDGVGVVAVASSLSVPQSTNANVHAHARIPDEVWALL